ncbi:hypothetical protein [Clostridium argentinense]|uniref:hypothetical protein n=1 Tax=Clostridium argentinense TaxID=29341 RepID=UPI000AD09F2D|nr:hypothetical protein [Clostridium argentinense]
MATFGVGAAIACAVAVACVGVICAAASTSTTNSSSSGGGENDIGARIMNAFKGALSGANHSPIIKSFNSLKEIGCDIWRGFENRGEKALDSPYDFVNWVAIGIPGAIKATLQSNAERSEKAFNSVYDFTNWLSFGTADMVKGAVNPEDPFSKEHWLNSFGVVSTILGVRKATISKGKTSMLDDIPRSSKVAKGGSNPEKQLLSDSKNKSNFGLEAASKTGIGVTGEGIPINEVSEKVLKEIHIDERAAYGYSPNGGTAYSKYDFTNIEAAKDNRIIRKEYLEQSQKIQKEINSMVANESSKQEIANKVIGMRNQDKILARAKMKPEDLAPIEARNMKIYGDKVGPDATWLFNSKKAKLKDLGLNPTNDEVWNAVINGAMKKDDVLNTLLGLKH